jgi:hypothetical protein
VRAVRKQNPRLRLWSPNSHLIGREAATEGAGERMKGFIAGWCVGMLVFYAGVWTADWRRARALRSVSIDPPPLDGKVFVDLSYERNGRPVWFFASREAMKKMELQ